MFGAVVKEKFVNLTDQEANLVFSIMRDLSGDFDHTEVRQRVGKTLLELLNADYFASYVWDEEQNKFVSCVQLNMNRENLKVYEDYYQFHDPITPTLQRRKRATPVSEVMSHDKLVRTEFFNDFFNVQTMNIPPHNVMESENDFQIEFSVPGSNKKDFEIELEKDNLKISKKKEVSNSSNHYSKQEFNYNLFQKSFYLPDSIDQSKITSKYDNGILRVFLPKKNEVIIENQKKFLSVK